MTAANTPSATAGGRAKYNIKIRSPLAESVWRAAGILLLCLSVNCCYPIIQSGRWILFAPAAAAFLAANLLPSFSRTYFPTFRLRMCFHGSECLTYFCVSAAVSAVFHIVLALCVPTQNLWAVAVSAAVCVCCEAVVFWSGIIAVYCTSLQLGIRLRVIGIICGPIPIAHLFALGAIIRVAGGEVRFETDKRLLNIDRAEERVCATKYPLFLVHGVFFRDSEYLNYWGRIPRELSDNGAVIYYGNHQSAASIENCGRELAARIKDIVEKTGCEKVNIIAHSKGGLDCRAAITRYGAAPFVASLTTINTPHRGCGFAEYLLGKVSESAKNSLASAYNSALRRLGDSDPDFIAAVSDLTATSCDNFNRTTPNVSGVRYASVGSRLNRAVNGKFPLNFSYPLVKFFDGPNDGLVSEPSFKWGGEYTHLTTFGRRGISHGDVIDLNRENIPGFDVREFYVQTVSRLRELGL